MASNPLIGTWRLLSWENRSVEDGQLSYPLGEDATGYIIYNEDGYVFVAIMASDRLRFAADDLLSATKEEEAQAEESYVSYCGRYDFDGDTEELGVEYVVAEAGVERLDPGVLPGRARLDVGGAGAADEAPVAQGMGGETTPAPAGYPTLPDPTLIG
jgi:Lipocalin-like domain